MREQVECGCQSEEIKKMEEKWGKEKKENSLTDFSFNEDQNRNLTQFCVAPWNDHARHR